MPLKFVVFLCLLLTLCTAAYRQSEMDIPTAQRDQSICYQPKDPGNCRMHILNWYYDSAGKRCERFVYGGCGGNRNNFETLEECMEKCYGA
ncbi:Kunitz-type serine protease inhibitor 1 like protein [Argiope bruennichi]|uniref:Kunitz-type serine protease inhibitor 1 like protein n=1 Tax=Argiope bruennichi TaxID=94029 RepID=A0A8T0EPQ6_ARGBR|nr:Kunitz-type serine protease inhibitor 1 like protein [Argiope bruennichi]